MMDMIEQPMRLDAKHFVDCIKRHQPLPFFGWASHFLIIQEAQQNEFGLDTIQFSEQIQMGEAIGVLVKTTCPVEITG